MSDETHGAKAPQPSDIPPAPLTLEGWSVLHQMFRVRRPELRKIDARQRGEMASQLSSLIAEMSAREDGQSAAFSLIGHKGDLILVHFRRTFDELAQAQRVVANLAASDFLEPTGSYLSVVEIGLYEATLALYQRLMNEGLAPHSPQWREAITAETSRQREKMAARLFPRVPERRYFCFYPMNKKRDGSDNWYRLPIGERRRLMHDHGMVGRRYAGEVTQIISGSTGFDDWEWGVDLFADDPIVFKKLVYEMRFDEASAGYAEFGPFYVGILVTPSEIAEVFGG